MGSLGAMQQGAADRYFQEADANIDKLVPEGIEGRVPYKGTVTAVIHQLMGACAPRWVTWDVPISTRCEPPPNSSRLPRPAFASRMHDVQITKEAPNYHVD